MKKVVLKVDLPDDKAKQKIMKRVSGMQGVDSISVDMKDGKLTVVGDIDPVSIVGHLRKHYACEILAVGPAKESDDKKKNVKADEPKKAGETRKDVKSDVSELVKAYEAYNPDFKSYYYVKNMDESPSACTIG